MARTVGIVADAGERFSERGACERSRAERVLVRRQLDAVLDAKLALELRVRLARHVGPQAPDARRGEALEAVLPAHCTARAHSTPWMAPIRSTSPAGTL